MPVISNFPMWNKTVTKEAVGLGNVDNTSDADKPVSDLQQQALDQKSDKTHTHSAADIGAAQLDENGLVSESLLPWRRHTVNERIRDPSKPDFGLEGGGGSGSVAIDAAAYTGDAKVTAYVNGVAYDALNISDDPDTATEGTLIIKPLEG